MAMTKIQTITVGSGGAASIDFTSIPGTYTDLMIVFHTRDDRPGEANGPVGVNFNGVTTSRTGRDMQGIYNAGANQVYSGTYTNTWIGYSNSSASTASTFGSNQIYIPNYASANNKSFSVESVAENNSTSGWSLDIFAGLWSSTSAINRLTLTAPLASTGFVQYSSATLYGITKGSSGGVTVS